MNPEQQYNPNNPQQNNNPQPQVYGPTSSAPNLPYGNPTPQPMPNQMPQAAVINDPPEQPKSRKGLVIAGIIGASLLVIALLSVIVVVALNQSSPNKKKTTTEQSGPAQVILPAQSVEVEQVSNALGQDLSRLDDEKDLPANSLDDTTLNL